jgi:hypothetical protein
MMCRIGLENERIRLNSFWMSLEKLNIARFTRDYINENASSFYRLLDIIFLVLANSRSALQRLSLNQKPPQKYSSFPIHHSFDIQSFQCLD